MKKRMLADVLWDAANVWLSNTQNSMFEGGPQRYLTCNAVAKEALSFMRELGCPTSSPDAFSEFAQGHKRQGVRYMWLLLAMHVAEDEGIEI